MSPATIESPPASPASQPSRSLVSIGERGIEITNMDELWRSRRREEAARNDTCATSYEAGYNTAIADIKNAVDWWK